MTSERVLLEQLQWIIGQWRTKAALMDATHATMGIGWKSCADDLAALLSALPQTPEQRQASMPGEKTKDSASPVLSSPSAAPQEQK